MIVIVRQSSVHLGWRQIRILLNDLRCTIAMGYVIRGNVNDPMAGAVNTRDTVRIERDVWRGHCVTHEPGENYREMLVLCMVSSHSSTASKHLHSQFLHRAYVRATQHLQPFGQQLQHTFGTVPCLKGSLSQQRLISACLCAMTLHEAACEGRSRTLCKACHQDAFGSCPNCRSRATSRSARCCACASCWNACSFSRRSCSAR